MRSARSGASAAAVAVGLILAGCLANEPTNEAPPPGPALPGGWALDCTLGTATTEPGWAQPCAVATLTTPRTKAETWVAVNPTNPSNVVVGAKDMDPAYSDACVWTTMAVTFDAGRTWKQSVVGGPFAQRAPGEPWYGYACNTDPMFAFDPDGLLYVVLDLYNLGPKLPRTSLAPAAKMLLATSSDGGLTWERVITLIETDGFLAAPDYPRIAVSPATGTVISTFIDFQAGARCYVFASRDQGRTSELTLVPSPGPGCTTLAVAPDGTIVVGAVDFVGAVAGFGDLLVSFARSTDDGRSFSRFAYGFAVPPAPSFEENDFGGGSGLEIVYDRTDGERSGRLYAIYTADGGAHADVFVRWSDDDGATWDDPVRVNDDAGDHDQWLANLAIAADGSMHAAFLDKGYDPGNRLVGVTHAMSLDGGLNWTTTRVTNVTFDGDLGRHQDGHAWLGDYSGIDAAGGDVWFAFPDSSLGREPVLAAARVTRAG